MNLWFKIYRERSSTGEGLTTIFWGLELDPWLLQGVARHCQFLYAVEILQYQGYPHRMALLRAGDLDADKRRCLLTSVLNYNMCVIVPVYHNTSTLLILCTCPLATFCKVSAPGYRAYIRASSSHIGATKLSAEFVLQHFPVGEIFEPDGIIHASHISRSHIYFHRCIFSSFSALRPLQFSLAS